MINIQVGIMLYNTKGDSNTNSAPNSDYAIAGAVSGCVTRFLCQPLDVLKIRFQLQVEPITEHHVSKYQSMHQAVYLILKEEGISALWKGHIPAQLLSIVYGMSQFYSYHMFMKLSDRLPVDDWKHSTSFVAGAAAGTVATITSFPFDTVRTRLVAQSSNHRVYQGILHSHQEILRAESYRGFFRGLWPTLLQIAPHTGLQFACYEFFTDLYKRHFDESTTRIVNSLIAGSTAGFIAKTVVYPLDLSRKRLQIQGFEHGRKGFGKFFRCEGMVHCLITTAKEEGMKGLFKGLWPSQLKAAATTALHFTVYEQVLLLLTYLR
ncbi:mitochondrial thiamine pyrophosphate carrier isoform X2 [Cephus cinctus]|uniref:Mitochondrial thiamine pyrophosphate carrier n=1 Tax=Cephus cinctus TaxID=211228 RepID=A0AAJ7BVP8_CEPCN|nr:mitochondrial thiamine pyrophosphate carrier isoform X2 [Cephus cinctus]